MLSDSIYPLLAIKLHQRNQAIGINGITAQVAGLLELYISSRQEMTNKYAQAFYYRAMIAEREREFNELMEDFDAGKPIDDPLGQAKRIEIEMNELAFLLEGLENGE